MKVVVLSHMHPSFTKGGAEIAAYNLWRGIDQLPDHQAWFIGRGSQQVINKNASLGTVGERNYLIAGDAEIRQLTATTALASDSPLAQLLDRIKPEIVHFHHYIHLGVEQLRLVKNICPDASIVLTLHEYIAICMNSGHMVKTDGSLCYRSSPRECHVCFPDMSVEDIFLRERYIKSFFRLVDRFISPSWFLRERYAAWGLDAADIEVIENGQPEVDALPPRSLQNGESRGRFAYFGQINPYKGLDVILQGFVNLPKNILRQVRIDIFGSALENQSEDFQEKISRLLRKLKGTAYIHGPYESEELGELMAETDWVVMGSVWWENSPLVIQEAYKFGRPVICPGIGGMAEKVEPGLGGINYRVRDSGSLASVISRVINEPDLFNQLHEKLPSYPRISDVTNQHIALYQEVRREKVL